MRTILLNIDWQNTWLVAIAGAVVGGIILLGFQQLAAYTQYRSKILKMQAHLIGVWNCYFYSNQNKTKELKFVSATLEIKKGSWREPEYVVYENREGEPNVTYTGTMEEELNCILIKMNSEDNKEFVLFRLYNYSKTEDMIMHGLQLSKDVYQHPYCGALLLAKSKKEEDQVKTEFKNFYFHKTSEQTITIITEKKK